MERIDDIISKAEKKVCLLKEYKEAIKYESCKYDLLCMEPGHFALYRIEDQSQLKTGPMSQIRSYIRLRNISAGDVYNRTKEAI